MQASVKVRAARKEMQLKRLAAKKDDPENYSKFYANQPYQKVRAVKAEEKRAARQALRIAQESLAVAEITGNGLQAAQEAAALASLVAHKLNVPASRAGSSLTAG